MNTSTNKAQDECENIGLGSAPIIRMDAKRATRFAQELGKLSDEIQSLGAAADHFPSICLSSGEMQPALTVSAFVAAMEGRIGLLFAMVNCEERIDEKGAANVQEKF